MTTAPRAASPVDFETHGAYGAPKPAVVPPPAPTPPPTATSTQPPASDAKPAGRPGPAFPHRVTAADAEPGRYHFYAAKPCPFCQRSMIIRELKGLQDVISVSVLDPMRDGRGWAFREGPGHGLDEVNGFALLREAYEASDPAFAGHVSAPVLWDRKDNRIATNDFRTLDIDIATSFDRWARNDVDLYPEPLRPEIDELNEFLFERIHNGPYRCGFAPSQDAYEREARALFEALDEMEQRLATSRYLFGAQLTVSDIRLFVTLARFDAVYVAHFKANLRRITDYPNLWAYARDLYQRPAFGSTTDFDQIKQRYFRTHTWINPSQLVPLGPEVDWSELGDRAHLVG
ncbi:glutathione S-transferase family protein [Catenulispora pinisilvae]|uniref:glutathione S-transferase family protein n=1 Tax=Catenulispora pinisilvae TaxID=2705253 RepID=UPI00189128E9|nr:glutathione S-transferase C-terminal domain-containing protein [Catenulispora pinisilvae]